MRRGRAAGCLHLNAVTAAAAAAAAVAGYMTAWVLLDIPFQVN
jgi:hypothetical protein